MSYVIDAASKINEVQLKAVTEGQNAVVELVRIAAEYPDQRSDAVAVHLIITKRISITHVLLLVIYAKASKCRRLSLL